MRHANLCVVGLLLVMGSVDANPPSTYRPNYPGSKLEFKLSPEAARRLQQIVNRSAPEQELSPLAPRLGPSGTFRLRGIDYLFFGSEGVLWRNRDGNRYGTWSDPRLKHLGKTMPRYGAWDQKSFDRWMAGLKQAAPTDGKREP